MNRNKTDDPLTTPVEQNSGRPGIGRFGDYGGRYVPEALIAALEELDEHRHKAAHDPGFTAELARLHKTYTGRPSICLLYTSPSPRD